MENDYGTYSGCYGTFTESNPTPVLHPGDIKEEPPSGLDYAPFVETKMEQPQLQTIGIEPPTTSLQLINFPFSCDRCGKGYWDEFQFSKHQEACITGVVPQCPICGQMYKSHTDLKYHMNRHYGIEPYECRVTTGCQARFAYPGIRCKHEVKCGNGAKPQPKLKASKAKPEFRCITCDKAFGTIRQRDRHQLSCGLTTTCMVCGKTTACTKTMVYHMNQHNGLKPFECRENSGCGYTFHSPGARNTHETRCRRQQEMDGEQPTTSCMNCGKTFSKQNHLAKHLKLCQFVGNVHSLPEEPPSTMEEGIKQEVVSNEQTEQSEPGTKESVKCDGCGKSFPSAVTLSFHQINCNMPKTCTICNREFASHRALGYHLNEHAGVPPFECRVTPGCQARFFQPNLHSRHENLCGRSAIYTTEQSESQETDTSGHFQFADTGQNSSNMLLPDDIKKEPPAGVDDGLFTEMEIEQTVVQETAGESSAGRKQRTFHHNCDRCGKGYWNTANLSKHQTSCNTTPQCTVCGLLYKSHADLKYHMNIHSGELPYECRVTPGCNARFIKPVLRCNHELKCSDQALRQEFNGFRPEIRCSKCNELFKTARHRDRHEPVCGLSTTCVICGKTTATVKSMVYHMNMHNDVRPYECREGTGCEYTFYSPGARNMHEVVCKGSKRKEIPMPRLAASCANCGKTFSKQSHLKQHRKLCQMPIQQSFPAELLEVQIKQEVDLTGDNPSALQDQSRHGILEGKGCKDCGKTFPTKNALSRHMIFCQISTKCDICGKQFVTHKGLIYHLNEHRGIRPFECRVTPGCPASFADPRMRCVHERKCGQRAIEPSPLDAPLQTAISEQSLQKDMAIPAETKKTLECSVCGMVFVSAMMLSRHQVTCTASTVCVLCGRTMATVLALQYHMNKHNGITPYKCRVSDTCKAKYSNPSARNIHEGVCSTRKDKSAGSSLSTVRKQLCCDRCGKIQLSLRRLMRHQNVCNVSTTCEECGRTFKNSYTLRNHMNKHNGVRPYQCRETKGCEARFHNPADRNRHELKCASDSGNPEAPGSFGKITCKHCWKTFVKIVHFERHEPICVALRDQTGSDAMKGDVDENVPEQEPPASSSAEVLISAKCVSCGAAFSCTEELQAHMRNCRAARTCTKCGKIIKTLRQLSFHMNRHTGLKPFRCRVTDGCPAEYHGPWLRVKHERLCRRSRKNSSVEQEGVCHRCGESYDPKTMRHVCEKEMSDAPDNPQLAGIEVVKWSRTKLIAERNDAAEEVVQTDSVEEGGEKERNVEENEDERSDATKENELENSGMEELLEEMHESKQDDQQVYKHICKICREGFASRRLLCQHSSQCYKSSLEKELYKCRASANCGESFKLVRQRIDHELECTAAGQLICKQCYKLLPSIELLEEHEASCQATDFTCRLCSATFSDVRYLRKHILGHEKPGHTTRWWEKRKINPVAPRRKRYNCDKCGTEFLDQDELLKHPRFCRRAYSCTQCPAAFATQCSLEYHTNEHNGIKPYQCRKPEGCTKTFSNPNHRRFHELVCGTSKEEEHMKKVEQSGSSAAKVFSCPHCPLTFKAVNELKYHVNEHNGGKEYPCRRSEDCKETFTTRAFRIKHEATCGGNLSAPKQPRKVELIACKDCGKVFSNLQYLRIHKQKCTGSDGPPTNLKCTLCEVISPDVDALQQHLDEHNREKPFKCRISQACDESYINERQRGNHELVCNADGQAICQRCFKLCPCMETLKVHEKTCRGTEFPCRLCEAVLRSRNSQLVHLLRHDTKKERKKMQACPECDKKFLRRSNFVLHLREHNMEPSDLRLKCEICSAEFKTSKSLQTHMNCHKGIKPYGCRYPNCAEAFFLPQQRTIHEQNCTKLQLSCEICEIPLNCMRDFQLHMKTHEATGLAGC